MGDVLGITEADGNFIAQYLYDDWGKLISIDTADEEGSTAYREIAEANPLRYRGYYYDNETGYYYLQSRYYDSDIGRFINSDSFRMALLSKNINLGINLIAYCNNNPVNNCDINGFISKSTAEKEINNFIKKYLIKIWPELNKEYKWETADIYRETSGNYTAKIKYYKHKLFKNSFYVTVGDYTSWEEDGRMSGQLNMEFINNQNNYMVSENKKGLSVSFTDGGPDILGNLFAAISVFIHWLVSLFQANTSSDRTNRVPEGWLYMFEITKLNSDINGRYALYGWGYKKV